jgi:phage gpG-like protein
MANTIEITVKVNNMARVRAMVDRLGRKAQGRRDLHARWAVLAMNWINKNFQTEGGLVGGWAPLRPGTLANRRKGSGRILQDTGELRQSFVPRWTSESATVGSPLKRALWHEKGTRPYIIKPKRAGGVLVFNTASGIRVKTKRLVTGKTIRLPSATGTSKVFTRLVHHPGLPARRMLPTADEPLLMRDLLKAAREYMTEQTNG